MNYRILSLTFLVLFVGGMTLTQLRRNVNAQAEAARADALVKNMAPPGATIQKIESPLPYFKLTGQDGESAIFFTHTLAPKVHAYGGPIDMAIRVDKTGRILDIRILSQNETLSYVGDLNTYVRAFFGKTTAAPMELGKDIDAITRATISSEAITRAIRESLALFSEQVLLQGKVQQRTGPPFPWVKLIVSLLIFGTAAAAAYLARKRLRWAVMAAGFIYFGLITTTMLSIVQIANIGLGNIPTFLGNPLWWLIIAFSFASALIIGRLYCASVCPFILVEEILHKLLTRRYAPTQVDRSIDQRARYLKYVFLFAVIAATFLLGNASPSNIEVYVTFFLGKGSKLAWALLALVLVVSIFHFRFWCVFLCPVGALTGLMSRFSFLKIKLKSGCSRCGRCEAICPTRAIANNARGLPEVDDAECILCGRCITYCPERKMNFRKRL
jgi:Na+-translocating ferredoxin:NAD+ oxidoreductase RnfG subunit/NAD-dependent dihydropyrimidine dehydrogenase PreA subunit